MHCVVNILFTQWLFDINKEKEDFYRVRRSIKKFCANIKEHVTERANCEKRKCYP